MKGAETSFAMASNGAGASEDEVKLYFHDYVIDHPGVELVYKGTITVDLYRPSLLLSQEQYLRDVLELTEAARKRAKLLGGNAVVGMKITAVMDEGRYTITGIVVRYSK